jgi:hypothetical protein
MAIRSTPFTGVVISGSDIAKFEKQIKKAAPSRAAKETFSEGKRLAAEYAEKGFVAIEATK